MGGKLYNEKRCRIVGACFEVRSEMGAGLAESTCRERLVDEQVLRGRPALVHPGSPHSSRVMAAPEDTGSTPVIPVNSDRFLVP